jgi:hypothetical protein
MRKQTFEQYLMNDVWEPEGVLDDDIQDAFEAWLEGVDVAQVMEYAEDYGNKLYRQAYIEGGIDMVNETNSLASNPN